MIGFAGANETVCAGVPAHETVFAGVPAYEIVFAPAELMIREAV